MTNLANNGTKKTGGGSVKRDGTSTPTDNSTNAAPPSKPKKPKPPCRFASNCPVYIPFIFQSFPCQPQECKPSSSQCQNLPTETTPTCAINSTQDESKSARMAKEHLQSNEDEDDLSDIAHMPFETLDITPEQLKVNTRYEEETEQWFSSPKPIASGFYPTQTIPGYPSAVEILDNQTTVSQAVPSVTSQDPDGIGWIDWTGSEWDGNPFDMTGKTLEQTCAFLFPSGNPYVVKGIREKFYEVNPFADNTSPTASEIADWNLEVIRHIRAMLNIVTPVNHDARLYLESRWADERKFTTYWDTKYPGTVDSGYGPCTGGTNPHCGASFFPDAGDRAPYLSSPPFSSDFGTYPELQNYNTRASQAEHVSSVNTDLPWSIKFSTMVAGVICAEGQTGHAGPYLTRTLYGCHWHVAHNGVKGTIYRGKWR